MAALREDTFDIAVIPHTWRVTNLSSLKTGSPVNLEVDILAKYVERLLQQRRPSETEGLTHREAEGSRVLSMPFAPIEEALADFRAGRLVIIVDDEDRENEGDLACAAELVTPEIINFMAREGQRPDMHAALRRAL